MTRDPFVVSLSYRRVPTGFTAALLTVTLLTVSPTAPLEAQTPLAGPRAVRFASADGLAVTADLYAGAGPGAPTLLLFHQSASSRGEFRTLGPRLARLGFNALAVDLRWGRARDGVVNETALGAGTDTIMAAVEAGEGSPWPTIDRSYHDMVAALDWLDTEGYGGARWALGSSFSAMLVFRLAAEDRVDAVLAYSPAEYDPDRPTWVRDHAVRVGVPAYLAAAPGEEADARVVAEALDSAGTVRVFAAPAGRHGASILDVDERNVADLETFLGFLHGGIPNRTEVEIPTPAGAVVVDWYPPAVEGGRIVALFHQGGMNARAEYGFLVPRLLRAGYGVVAADLPGGGTRFGFPNRTAVRRGVEESRDYCGAAGDLETVVRWAARRSGAAPVIWGSSYSAALVLRAAAADPGGIGGVLAFSPASGEPMAGCTPEAAAATLATAGTPTLVVRPASEMEIESVARQMAVFAAAGVETWVADPGVHGSSTLNPLRIDAGTDGHWARIARFLERIDAGR